MAIGPIGKQGKQPDSEQRGSRVEDGFPEMPRTSHVPNSYSIATPDASCAPAYIARSEKADGHQQDDVNVRMDRPFSDYTAYDAEPIGSAPQSGEGVNAASKPQGKGLEPENDDYYN